MFLSYGVALFFCIYLFEIGRTGLETDSSFSSAMALGVGLYDPRAAIGLGIDLPESGAWALASRTVIVNAGQVILSIIYFAYNAILTSMCTASEAARYARVRRGLRVSSGPRGKQRSTYMLQLPMRYALPLLALSAVLHWLVSQAIFVLHVRWYAPDGSLIAADERARVGQVEWEFGYSLAAIFAVVVVSAVLIASLFVYGLVPLKSDMPLLGNCSAAIASSCHPARRLRDRSYEGDADDVEAKIQWGVTVEEDGDEPGHCAFSSGPVTAPIEGRLYR